MFLAADGSSFGLVLFIVVFAALAIGAIALVANRGIYDQIGRGGLQIGDDADGGGRREPAPAVSAAERDAEIRQMLDARNARLERQGRPTIDVEAELRRLTATRAAADPELEQEVRSLVIARNERRLRRGEEPLDVETEVARQLRELG